jgi:hypothetical protein
MKIAVYTQYFENYGSVDSPHWKSKGGATYLINNLSVKDVFFFKDDLTLFTNKFNFSNEFAEECVVNFNILDDDDMSFCKEWELPFLKQFTRSDFVAA